MCTALTLSNKTKTLFGRNNDIEYSFGQQIVITPRNFVWPMRFQKPLKQPTAIIGMAVPFKDAENGGVNYPLYAEAANEYGLGAAGLNFPGNAFYPEPGSIPGAYEITQFEFIPWVLGMFKNVKEVKEFLKNNDFRIVNRSVCPQFPASPLHFIVSDKSGESLVIEQTKEGVKTYDNPTGIMTNNPPFDFQLQNLSFYQGLEPIQRTDVEWGKQALKPFGQGFGSFGLPGDWTPPSRFVRTAFLKNCSSKDLTDEQLVSQFFHILDNVAFVKGSIVVKSPNGNHDDITLYSCAVDLETGDFYYKTYDNNQISVVQMKNENLDAKDPIVYPFPTKQSFNYVNKK